MDWHKQVLDNRRDVRFDKGKKLKFNDSQCDNLCRAFVSKLSKFCDVAPGPNTRRISLCREESVLVTDGDDNSKVVLGWAWNEVYRVIREAEVYLQACSGTDWWKRALTMAATGEAHVVHLHDLLCCVAGLEMGIILAGNIRPMMAFAVEEWENSSERWIAHYGFYRVYQVFRIHNQVWSLGSINHICIKPNWWLKAFQVIPSSMRLVVVHIHRVAIQLAGGVVRLSCFY